MNILDFNPTPLYCSYYNAFHSTQWHYKLIPRKCYHYEFEIFPNSYGGCIINNKYYPMRKYDICIRKPGDTIESISPYDSHFLCFDTVNSNIFPNDFTFYPKNKLNFSKAVNLLNELPTKMSPVCFPALLEKFVLLENCSLNGDSLSLINAKQLTLEIVSLILNEYHEIKNIVSLAHPYIKKTINYINQNYTNDIKINDFILQFPISKAYFYRCFKEACVNTPLQYITKLRMNKAKSLLIMSPYNITDISIACGYSNCNYFIKHFKKHFGTTPYVYRKNAIDPKAHDI